MTAAETQARERDGQDCRRCGRSVLNYPSSLHHRQPKGMGGGSRDRYDRVENLVLVCGTGSTPDCHFYIHNHPAESYQCGWLVRRGKDPAEVPLLTATQIIMLTPDGTAVVNDLIPIDPNLEPPF